MAANNQQGSSKLQRVRDSAVLPEMGAAKYIACLVLAIVVQLLWGLYSVCTRYLQVCGVGVLCVVCCVLCVVCCVLCWGV